MTQAYPDFCRGCDLPDDELVNGRCGFCRRPWERLRRAVVKRVLAIWIHRPVITTHHRQCEEVTAVVMRERNRVTGDMARAYDLGRASMTIAPSVEVRRHAERVTSTGAVLVAVV